MTREAESNINLNLILNTLDECKTDLSVTLHPSLAPRHGKKSLLVNAIHYQLT